MNSTKLLPWCLTLAFIAVCVWVSLYVGRINAQQRYKAERDEKAAQALQTKREAEHVTQPGGETLQELTRQDAAEAHALRVERERTEGGSFAPSPNKVIDHGAEVGTSTTMPGMDVLFGLAPADSAPLSPEELPAALKELRSKTHLLVPENDPSSDETGFDPHLSLIRHLSRLKDAGEISEPAYRSVQQRQIRIHYKSTSAETARVQSIELVPPEDPPSDPAADPH